MMEEKNSPIDFEGWLRQTVAKLQQGLQDYKVGIGQASLLNSIAGELIRSGAEVEQILIKFRQYGRFVDMGVGRGMPLGSREKLGAAKFLGKRAAGGQLHQHQRYPKPWFSKTKTAQVAQLRHLLAEHYADKVINQVEGALTK